MTTAYLLDPVDLLFCRDGRPIVAGEGAAAGSGLPSPQVVAGAIRTALLRQRGHLPADGSRPLQAHVDAVMAICVRGPLLADDQGRPFIPMPADLVGDKPKHGQKGIPKARLVPTRNIPGWTPPDDAPQALALWPEQDQTAPSQGHERHRPGDLAPQQGFLTWDGFDAWAKGGRPTQAQVKNAGDLWGEETRTQVALSASAGTAEDGHLFSTRYLRLKPGICLYIEVDSEEPLPETVTLGGDRRQVRVRRAIPAIWPTTGTCALALTPTVLPVGRVPAAWTSDCRGLAIPGADPVSGWDLAKQQPRPVRWALRAGSVWHLNHALTTCTSIGDETPSGFGWIALGATPTAKACELTSLTLG